MEPHWLKWSLTGATRRPDENPPFLQVSLALRMQTFRGARRNITLFDESPACHFQGKQCCSFGRQDAGRFVRRIRQKSLAAKELFLPSMLRRSATVAEDSLNRHSSG